jgi:cephalosporin hydroxylase
MGLADGLRREARRVLASRGGADPRVAQLEARVAELKDRVAAQRAQIAGLEEEQARLKEEASALRERARSGPVWRPPREDVAAMGVLDAFHTLFYDEARAHMHATWLGTRVRKSPTDLWTYQEILAELRPDLLIETGTKYGGSALYFASLMDLLDHGEVVSIDIVENERLPTHPRVTYLTGSSTDPAILTEVARRVEGKATVLVCLDSDHSAAHVADELRAYARFVTPGSYLVVEDTNINGHPVGRDWGPGPMEALDAWLPEAPDFEIDPTREKYLLTYQPRGWLRRR